MPEQYPISLSVGPEAEGKRLDQFLAAKIAQTSRARVQQLISEEKVLVNDSPEKSSFRLRGNEHIVILGGVQLPPLRAIPEEISLEIVFEDDDLAVVNKPAGMMVHAGAGATEADRNRGTLVNALLHRFQKLSGVGGEMRPGIVHRLDKATSGLIVVAKNDEAHRRMSAQFAQREVKKKYIALVHGWLKQEQGTITSAISRDRVHRTKMTTRRDEGREAISHYAVRQRIDSPVGKFTLVEVKIDTGRTHQIRVHLSSLGHPVVGDSLYGAPKLLHGKNQTIAPLARNFLHAAALQFQHPRSGKSLSFSAALPTELEKFLGLINPGAHQ